GAADRVAGAEERPVAGQRAHAFGQLPDRERAGRRRRPAVPGQVPADHFEVIGQLGRAPGPQGGRGGAERRPDQQPRPAAAQRRPGQRGDRTHGLDSRNTVSPAPCSTTSNAYPSGSAVATSVARRSAGSDDSSGSAASASSLSGR